MLIKIGIEGVVAATPAPDPVEWKTTSKGCSYEYYALQA